MCGLDSYSASFCTNIPKIYRHIPLHTHTHTYTGGHGKVMFCSTKTKQVPIICILYLIVEQTVLHSHPFGHRAFSFENITPTALPNPHSQCVRNARRNAMCSMRPFKHSDRYNCMFKVDLALTVVPQHSYSGSFVT